MKHICCDCGKEKVLETDFYKSKHNALGYSYHCKECSKERSRISHQKHYEKMKEKHYEWVANHPEHKEYQSTYFKDYRQLPDYKERNKEYQKKYDKSPRGYVINLIRHARRRKRSRLLINDLTYEQLLTIKESQQNCCAICGREFTEDRPYEMDHIIPVSKSKPGDPGLTMGNVQLLCRSCNASKGNR